MPVVGSSRSSRAGSESSAIANRSRCCSPPEHFATLRSAMVAIPALTSTSSTGRVSANRLAVYSTVSRTERSLSSPPVCMTAATSPRAIALRGSMPKTSADPDVGRESPRIMSMVVVLPAPLGPRNATTSPGSSTRSTPRTAWTDPKSLDTPVSPTAGTLVVRPEAPSICNVMRPACCIAPLRPWSPDHDPDVTIVSQFRERSVVVA